MECILNINLLYPLMPREGKSTASSPPTGPRVMLRFWQADIPPQTHDNATQLRNENIRDSSA